MRRPAGCQPCKPASTAPDKKGLPTNRQKPLQRWTAPATMLHAPARQLPAPLPPRVTTGFSRWQVFWLGDRPTGERLPAAPHAAVAYLLPLVLPHSGGAAPDSHRVPSQHAHPSGRDQRYMLYRVSITSTVCRVNTIAAAPRARALPSTAMARTSLAAEIDAYFDVEEEDLPPARSPSSESTPCTRAAMPSWAERPAPGTDEKTGRAAIRMGSTQKSTSGCALLQAGPHLKQHHSPEPARGQPID